MIRALSLLLPVLVPSWRFFAMVAPSPRIEVAIADPGGAACSAWQEFRPRPARISVWGSLRNLFWNPHWNETLYLTACAERFLADGSKPHLDYIVRRVRADLQHPDQDTNSHQVLIRLVVVMRSDGQVVREELYRSPAVALVDESNST